MQYPNASGATPQRRQQGVSLVEVLIAVLVLSIGLLGAAALQSSSLRNNHSAMQRSVGTILTYSIIDAMRANNGINGTPFNAYATGWCAGGGGGLVSSDLAAWQNRILAAAGPTACGQVACGAQSCTVGVRWDDSNASGGGANTIVQVEVAQ